MQLRHGLMTVVVLSLACASGGPPAARAPEAAPVMAMAGGAATFAFPDADTATALHLLNRLAFGPRVDAAPFVSGSSSSVLERRLEELTMSVREPLITTSIRRISGTPVFAGTRVPVQTLIDYLEAGDSLENFLSDFPNVTREHAIPVLELAKSALLAKAVAA